MVITIKKAAIVGSLFLKYSYEMQNNDVKDKVNTGSDAPIHDDLRKLFRQLVPHFAFICEEVKDEKLIKKCLANPDDYLVRADGEEMDETFLKYRVSEFEVQERKGYAFVTISGAKQLSTGEEIYFTTPSIDADGDYKFLSDLNSTIENLKEEVILYMQGKHAPKAQFEMFAEEDSNEEAGSAFVSSEEDNQE